MMAANKIIPSRQSSIVGLVGDVHSHMEVSPWFLIGQCLMFAAL